MTKIKFCGICKVSDVLAVNELMPDYAGFVFAVKSRRSITHDKAKELKSMLDSKIQTAGVFVNDDIEKIALMTEFLDIIQLHGNEDDNYIKNLKKLTGKIIIKAFKIQTAADIDKALKSVADYILLDSGKGTGKIFDWKLVKNISRPFFLAGGLDSENVSNAIKLLNPFAVDVSSGIETNGTKDKVKMAAFIKAVRKGNLKLQ